MQHDFQKACLSDPLVPCHPFFLRRVTSSCHQVFCLLFSFLDNCRSATIQMRLLCPEYHSSSTPGLRGNSQPPCPWWSSDGRGPTRCAPEIKPAQLQLPSQCCCLPFAHRGFFRQRHSRPPSQSFIVFHLLRTAPPIMHASIILPIVLRLASLIRRLGYPPAALITSRWNGLGAIYARDLGTRIRQ